MTELMSKKSVAAGFQQFAQYLDKKFEEIGAAK